MAEFTESHQIKEGFICPICHEDLHLANTLITHFQELHSEEQDVLKSLKELLGKARRKILVKFDEPDSDIEPNEIPRKFFLEPSEPQDPGTNVNHTEYFKMVRRDRLDHRTTETNRLILRLDKLLKLRGHDKKQQEQYVVAWLDGTTVTRCPSCAAGFNIAKRQHHCRLCGSIMCNSCSQFLPCETASAIITSRFEEDATLNTVRHSSESIRVCFHCMDMLENRRHVQMRQTIQLPICVLYERLQKLKNRIQPSVDLYVKMYSSLTTGDTTFQLQDAQSLKVSLAKQSEILDSLSKKIAALPVDTDVPQMFSLQNSIRRATAQYLKDNILALPVLPTHSELEKIKSDRLLRNTVVVQDNMNVHVKRITVTTGWSPANVPGEDSSESLDDPLMEQMNIVRNYIDQARKAQRFEEVASLRENLKMLKESYRKRQKDNQRNE